MIAGKKRGVEDQGQGLKYSFLFTVHLFSLFGIFTAVKFIIMIKFKVIGISSLMELNTHKSEMFLGIPWQSSD